MQVNTVTVVTNVTTVTVVTIVITSLLSLSTLLVHPHNNINILGYTLLEPSTPNSANRRVLRSWGSNI